MDSWFLGNFGEEGIMKGDHRLPVEQRDFYYDDEMAPMLGLKLNTLHKKISIAKTTDTQVALPPYKIICGKRRWSKIGYAEFIEAQPEIRNKREEE